jgi:RHS repeat-associated protein
VDSEEFRYDPAANRLNFNSRQFDHVKDNRLKQWRDQEYTYDAWGNLIEKRTGHSRLQTFSYDFENRLVRAETYTQGRLESTGTYRYDSLGRRVGKTSQVNGTEEHKRFLWQGLRMLREESPRQSSLYLYEPGSYAPLARVDQAEGEEQKRYYFHTDQIGTPLEMTDAQGQIVWQATYRAWGTIEALVVNQVEQNLRFQGQYFDDETGLHYNTFRYYDPEVGRFITQDPIGLLGGDNLYRYAPSPVSWADAIGLTPCSIKYGELDALGRPTGVRARLDSSHINSGTHANPNIQPPGFITGAGSNRARGHLLGRQLGGSGDDVRNLVTIQQRPANTPVMSAVEGRIRKALEQGGSVDMNILPIYHGPSRIPAGLTIKAEGTGGFFEYVTILNPPGM